ncbi:hypothetical protein BofuT4_P026830.1 [Botrytis cinerea T4]|uniref:Uncharacterized protein n=1 Tax=Botryotinia fuckeliana (strain T4) TaxID=999810 RepID=G2YAQ8_BOTF4|nr:hypothetical protein BofuT4_P026830.1 [Botrytis cinerea T4]
MNKLPMPKYPTLRNQARTHNLGPQNTIQGSEIQALPKRIYPDIVFECNNGEDNKPDSVHEGMCEKLHDQESQKRNATTANRTPTSTLEGWNPNHWTIEAIKELSVYFILCWSAKSLV